MLSRKTGIPHRSDFARRDISDKLEWPLLGHLVKTISRRVVLRQSQDMARNARKYILSCCAVLSTEALAKADVRENKSFPNIEV